MRPGSNRCRATRAFRARCTPRDRLRSVRAASRARRANVSRAAEQLGITQSAMSAAMSRLRAGRRLIGRTLSEECLFRSPLGFDDAVPSSVGALLT
ncbi:LysR family transcriptional regulator [Paraburkholderia sp. BR13444]|uniref:LysR family transcriptional regulator n=1 Tax=Paraburkholderia sp. BR13444 TaxID=3236997 RepID=UPI0034CFD65B